MSPGANYTATRVEVEGWEVLRLADEEHATEVSIAPGAGNNVFEMKVNGRNVLWMPFRLSELTGKPAYAGTFFMAPWANRLDQNAFYSNGKKHLLNPHLNNFPRDSSGLPIHGLLVRWPEWKVTALEAGADSAHATCRLEFWRYPDLVSQFPFAHTIEVTHRLQAGVLEIETVVENHAAEPMPVSLGYHPFFTIHDAPRHAWKVGFAARECMILDEKYLPTGAREAPAFENPQRLGAVELTAVFTRLVRDAGGRAEFWVEGERERVTMSAGPNYDVVVAYAPPDGDFVCLEPMAGTINAFNLAHAGRYPELQAIPPGGRWRESFWISTSHV